MTHISNLETFMVNRPNVRVLVERNIILDKEHPALFTKTRRRGVVVSFVLKFH